MISLCNVDFVDIVMFVVFVFTVIVRVFDQHSIFLISIISLKCTVFDLDLFDIVIVFGAVFKILFVVFVLLTISISMISGGTILSY